MRLWAVIPSRFRRDRLLSLVNTLLEGDNTRVVIVDNGYADEVREDESIDSFRTHVVKHHEDPPNISRLWNRGLDYAYRFEDSYKDDAEFMVAVLNDDLTVSSALLNALSLGMARTGATVAYPDQHGIGRDVMHQRAEPISLFLRMTGYAFALRGSARLRADETLQWWYGDDDIDWRARNLGGSMLVGGVSVTHHTPNETTVGVLAEQAGRDRQTFINKWGRAPW